MRVAVQGHADRGMPEQVLNQLRVGTTREQESSARVPQIVPAYLRQSRPPKQRLEVAVDDVLSLLRGALALGEYKAVILPLCAHPKLCLCLALPVASECFYGPLRQIYGTSAGILRLREYETATVSHPL